MVAFAQEQAAPQAPAEDPAAHVDGPQNALTLLPPRVVESQPPRYPATMLGSGEHPTVLLKLTVLADAKLGDLSVEHSGGTAFDQAALESVRMWRFEPARLGDLSVPSRVSVAVHFDLPELLTLEVAAAAAKTASPQPERSALSVPLSAAPETEPSYSAEAVMQQELRAGASDFQIKVGALSLVPRSNASDLLKLAPGILLTNEGGEGHAEQIFMRGFDARAGQDVELTVDGVPINDSGNLHGNGYADTHFVIPELVSSIRVIEGPFSPTQGNYAVAGSADFQLGLAQRGATAKLTYGSWDTKRALLMWAPPGQSAGTFGAVEARDTSGFGSDRSAKRVTAHGQYELQLDERSTLRLGAQAYATHFQSAGVVRQDDWESGRVGFFGTEDKNQGGDASRFSLYSSYDRKTEHLQLAQSLFLIRRDMRGREDFTGFLLDTQDALDTLHAQRGDLLDTNFGAWTFGGRGSGTWSTVLGGVRQSVELGYYARLDLTNATQYRNAAVTDIPYRLDTSLDSSLVDIAMYADAVVRPLRWLTFRGGLRVDTFTFNVLNNCAAQGDFDDPSRTRPPTNESCHDQTQFGAHREPVQRSSTGAVKMLPRATLVLGPFADLSLTGSYGEGVRSIDPIYIAQDLNIPFASIRAYEAGADYKHDFGPLRLSARSVFFVTKVDRDLIFNQTVGRNTLANGTTRRGWLGALRIGAGHFDSSTNLTFVRARFDDTGLSIPYVPAWVLREDAALFADLPWKLWREPLTASAALGYSFIGHRALPYGEQSNVISVVDGSASLGWLGFHASLQITNLLDRRYHLGEYNYASDFHSQPQPTLVPSRQFTAGAPRGFFVSLAKTWGQS